MDRHNSRTPPKKVHLKKKWENAITAGVHHLSKPKISIKMPDEEQDQLNETLPHNIATEVDYETDEDEEDENRNIVLVSTIFCGKMKIPFNIIDAHIKENVNTFRKYLQSG